MAGKNSTRYAFLTSALIVIAGFTTHPLMLLSRTKIPDESVPPSQHFADVKVPRGYRVPPVHNRRFTGRDITIDLFAAVFAQGMAVYAEIYKNRPDQDKDLTVRCLVFDKRDVLLSKRPWGYRALIGLNPETGAGMRQMTAVYSVGGVARAEHFTVAIAETEYQFYPGALDLGTYSDVDYRPTEEEMKFINRCTAKKSRVFSEIGPDLLSNALSHPRNNHYVTSPFWAKRLVMRYRNRNGKKIRFKDQLNIHRGIDLRGKTGEPVYSMADGKIAIAEPMYYEGMFIVIDHGNRIFSYYMHLDSLNVSEGDRVRAGDLIGRVGSTGLSTAAHLHVSLMIQEVYVDPLSMLALPVRN
ncbi:MAG: hypothetical protein A2176_05065 [Spirochaetes bacterium RBG_13_51_14]|nr:MAG: hypothetical protein A2176_05065 [Spirochaetes bacterium RBG_13_51_14]